MMKLGKNKTYTVEYLDAVVKEDIPRLTARSRQIIKQVIEECLVVDPFGFGKPLRYSVQGHRRLTVGSFQIIYRIDFQENKIIVVAIQSLQSNPKPI